MTPFALSQETKTGLRLTAQILGMVWGCALLASFLISHRDLDSKRVRILPSFLVYGGQRHQCYFCGMTRSFCAMSAGEFRAARAYHPAGPYVYLGFLLMAIWSGLDTISGILGRRASRQRRDNRDFTSQISM